MNISNQIDTIIKKIDQAQIISFDMFDTLVKRLTNRPEDVFALVGRHFEIPNFEYIRVEAQRSASFRANSVYQIPHANYDQIYEQLERRYSVDTDWNLIKQYEYELEKKVIKCNEEIKVVYDYAIKQGKRIIVVSDMYFQQSYLKDILTKCGYTKIDAIYSSADLQCTKYDGDIFDTVSKIEKCSSSNILHIGDNVFADVQNAQKAGWNAVAYIPNKVEEEKKYPNGSPIDFGVSEYLINKDKTFWYNLGICIGGPLYTGIYQWFLDKMSECENSNIYFLSRDGYNLYNIMRNEAPDDDRFRYMYASRRSMLLASIKDINDQTLSVLPPFTLNQTVGEILDYLCLPQVFYDSIQKIGFETLDSIIATREDMDRFKKLYLICENDFLKKCEEERKEFIFYLNSIHFFEKPAVVFDCGWNGSSQYLLEEAIEAAGYEKHVKFLYVGILNTEKSKRQLVGREYETFLFDQDKNTEVQFRVAPSIVILELFFGAPHGSVLKYRNAMPVFESTEEGASIKGDILEGIGAYLRLVCVSELIDIVKYSPLEAIESVLRLIEHPTDEEAISIGNIKNVDGFAKQKDVVKYIAKLDKDTLLQNPDIEIYWAAGLFKRKDISEEVKLEVAQSHGLSYHREIVSKPEKTNAIKEGVYKKYYSLMKKEEDLYSIWIREYEERNLEKKEELLYNPKFSVVIPVYNVLTNQLEQCINSVLDQTYTNWELILVDDCSTWKTVRRTLKRYEKKKGIRIIYREENGNISKATNDGINAATGEYIAFMDCDDVISINALYEMAKKINENKNYDFVYSDEDKLSEDGKKRHSPFFKPDWSPDTFMALMYTNHLSVYRTSIVKETGGLRSEFNGAQDYDFTLRFMELSDNKKVGHVPKILYHWREREESIASNMQAKPYALEAMKKLKEEAIKRRGLNGKVEYMKDMCQYRVIYHNTQKPLISIIIPSKDNYIILKQCIQSIYDYTEYENFEVVLVDNGSSEAEKMKIEKLTEKYGIKYIYISMEFNFSKMCNIGVANSSGEYIVLLNDDIEICQKDWLDTLLGQASIPYAGAVGAKLLYPDTNLIQHIGIINLPIGPSHSEIKQPDNVIYYFGRNRVNYNWIAVTGACLMVSKEKYIKAGKMDEMLAIAYNDVDLGFSLYEKGYYNVVREDVVCYHHESVSRGVDDVSEKRMKRLLKERQYLYKKHPELEGRDPFYNCNLASDRGDFVINIDSDSMEFTKKVEKYNRYSQYPDGIQYSIDQIVEGNAITIQGWMFSNIYFEDLLKRYMILESETGEIIKFPLNRIERIDVKKAYNVKSPFLGFKVVIPKGCLKTEQTQYKIGLFEEYPIRKKNKFVYTNRTIGLDTENK